MLDIHQAEETDREDIDICVCTEMSKKSSVEKKRENNSLVRHVDKLLGFI